MRLALPSARHRVLALALAASAVLHAAVMVGVPGALAPAVPEPPPLVYEASLVAAPPPLPAAPPPPARPPRRAPRPRLARTVPPDVLAAIPVEVASDAGPEAAPLEAAPEILALAQPAVPVAALEPPAFPVEALPAEVSIEYQLTSAFADGKATYSWVREGDNYRIRSEAQAEGFFTLFLEGRLLQESRGTVGAAGLRPESFVEQRPGAVEEGLDFDWAGRTITFRRKGESRTAALEDNTVDWLSMIFQLAHVPPTGNAQDMQVFTQRRMYRFRLQVVGVEEVQVPLGRVRALHLRHEDANRPEAIDVWLGIDQHYLPVKLRYPVARNRLVVDQVATRLDVRRAP